jgi:hypothetical protein
MALPWLADEQDPAAILPASYSYEDLPPQMQGLLMSPEDVQQAKYMGLLSAGLGMLANNTGHYGHAAPAIGLGGQAGVEGYGNALKMAQMQRSSVMQAQQHLVDQQLRAQQQRIYTQRLAEQQQRQQMKYGPLYDMFANIDPSKISAPQAPGAIAPNATPPAAVKMPIAITSDEGDGEDQPWQWSDMLDADGNPTQGSSAGSSRPSGTMTSYVPPATPVSMDTYAKAKEIMDQAREKGDPLLAMKAWSMVGGKTTQVAKPSQRMVDAAITLGLDPTAYQSWGVEDRKQVQQMMMGGKGGAKIPIQLALYAQANGLPMDQSQWTPQQSQGALHYMERYRKAGATSILNQLGNNGGVNPSTGLSGEDYLDTLPAGQAALVRKIAAGDVNPKTLKLGKDLMPVMSMVVQFDPDFDQSNIDARYKTKTQFATGKQGDAVRSANQAMHHGLDLIDSIYKLDNYNGAGTLLNPLVNAVQEGTGDPRQGLFRQNMKAFSSELRKFFSGSGGGGLTELEQWEKEFPVNASREQQIAYVKKAMSLLNGGVEAMQNQYRQGMGSAVQTQDLLTPEARQTIEWMLNGGPTPERFKNGMKPESGPRPLAPTYRPGQAQTATAAPPPAAPPAAQKFDMLPPASQYMGKTMRSDDGKMYKSNGKIWQQVK